MRYIFNPGDFLDVQLSDRLEQFAGRNYGDLYRVDSDQTCLERFDRSTGNWYEMDRDERAHVQIKVLKAAGFHP